MLFAVVFFGSTPLHPFSQKLDLPATKREKNMKEAPRRRIMVMSSFYSVHLNRYLKTT
jgi:hypothetical protein